MSYPNIIQQHTTDIQTIKSTYLPLSGGNISGNLIFCNTENQKNYQLCVNNNSSYLELYGGIDDTSSILQLYGNEYTANSSHTASIRLITGLTETYTTRKELLLKPSGDLTWMGYKIPYMIKQNGSSSTKNFSRKHSDGFIEQWGESNGNGTAGRVITFPIPFTSTNYHVFIEVYDGSAGDGQFALGTWSNKTTSNVKIWTTYNGNLGTWTFSWYACGY